MMSYPLLSMIWRHQYPMLSIELVQFFASIILLALLLAVLTAVCRPWLANFILAISTALIMVLQFNMYFEWAALLLAIAVIVALVAGGKFQQLVFYVFLALIIGALIDSRLDLARNYGQIVETEQQTSLPLVVHILLDGFIGLDGLPPQDRPQEVRSDVVEFFRKNDFELYNRAYSHYHATQDSLTHAFNFTNDGESLALKAAIFHTKLSIPENR